MDENPEEKFGISEYINNQRGVYGIIKQRFSDFIVNEVTSSGKIIHLTSQDVIPVPLPSAVSQTSNTQQLDEITDHELELLKVLAGQQHMKTIKPSVIFTQSASGAADYVKSDKNSSGNCTKEVKISVTDLTKERRTAIHQFIKFHFPNLNSCTKEIGDKKYVCVTRKENASKHDKRNSWPKSQSHVNFVLYKENIDTIEAVNILASKLRLRPNMFFYGGTKDRRGKTSQLLSVHRVPPENISSASKAISKIKVGNFHYSNKSQRLGSHAGNHFKIALREVEATDEIIENGCTSLANKGFINYFGLQRFGSCTEASTYSIGKALLQSNWQQAVDLILLSRKNDKPELAKAREIWFETRDAKEALRPLKRCRVSTEGQLLAGLARHGNTNYLNAIEMIPRNTKCLYVHAYQSYVWNKVVSKRIQKYKLNVLPGDIIRDRNRSAKDKNRDLIDIAEDGASEDAVDEEYFEDDCKGIRFLTEEELTSTDIEKVLMPIPGYDSLYPNNEIKQWYLEYLEMDGLSFQVFKNKVKTLSLRGAYRAMVVRPESLKWSTCFYDDATKPLLQSDWDVLQNIEVIDNRLQEGAYKALILEFSLPASAYATMAIREILNIGTSPKLHTSLNSAPMICETNTKLEFDLKNKRATSEVVNENGAISTDNLKNAKTEILKNDGVTTEVNIQENNGTEVNIQDNDCTEVNIQENDGTEVNIQNECATTEVKLKNDTTTAVNIKDENTSIEVDLDNESVTIEDTVCTRPSTDTKKIPEDNVETQCAKRRKTDFENM